jgi:hypothetical protein
MPRTAVRAEGGADGGGEGGGEVEGAPGHLQPAVRVGAAEQQHPRRVEGAEDTGDDGFGGEAGAEFLPAPHPGPVGVILAFRDDSFDARGGVPAQPTRGDGGVGGGGGEHHPRRQVLGEEFLQRGAPVAVGEGAEVGAAVGEQVEHHERRRRGGGELADAGGAGPEPVLLIASTVTSTLATCRPADGDRVELPTGSEIRILHGGDVQIGQ